jgi:hypothetical protein
VHRRIEADSISDMPVSPDPIPPAGKSNQAWIRRAAARKLPVHLRGVRMRPKFRNLPKPIGGNAGIVREKITGTYVGRL